MGSIGRGILYDNNPHFSPVPVPNSNGETIACVCTWHWPTASHERPYIHTIAYIHSTIHIFKYNIHYDLIIFIYTYTLYHDTYIYIVYIYIHNIHIISLTNISQAEPIPVIFPWWSQEISTWSASSKPLQLLRCEAEATEAALLRALPEVPQGFGETNINNY